MDYTVHNILHVAFSFYLQWILSLAKADISIPFFVTGVEFHTGRPLTPQWGHLGGFLSVAQHRVRALSAPEETALACKIKHITSANEK